MSTNKPKSSSPQTKKIVYHLTNSFVVKPVFWVYFRGAVIDTEKVPLEGKLVIVSNHASVFDPPLLSGAIPRPIAYMAKEELFRQPAFGGLISSLGAYPVNREGFDRSAIREAINRLDQGWAVGIFIEGTRTVDGKVYDPKLGAALISAKTQAPLLPVCLCGTEKILNPDQKLPQPVKVRVKVGDLIQPPSSVKKEQLEKVTAQCAMAINLLHDEMMK